MSTPERTPDNKPVIFFDLDRTMLNTGEFTASITAYFQKKYKNKKLDSNAFARWKDEYIRSIGSRTKYDPVEITEFWHTELVKLGLGKNTSADQLHREFEAYVRKSAKKYFYKDTLPTLKKLHSLGVILCLFTQGVQAWQLLKVIHIERFFQYQFVNPDKTSEASLAYIQSVLRENGLIDRPMLLVDDSPAIINALHRTIPSVELFFITREGEEQTYAHEYLTAPVTSITEFSPVMARVRQLLKGASSAAE